MKREVNIFLPILFLVFCLQAFACKHDNNGNNNDGKNSVHFDPRFVHDNKVDYKESQIFLKIESSMSWEMSITAEDDFVTADIFSGEGNKDIVLFVKRNLSRERKAKIRVVFSDKSVKELILIQTKADEPLPDPSVASRMEIPRLSDSPDSRFVAHYTRTNKGEEVMNFCLEFVLSKHQSRWVAFRFDSRTSPKNVKRQDTWSDDPKLLGLTAMGTYPYFKGVKLDRGHIVASSDRLFSKEANEQTFYYSNIAPQMGKKFNQGVWSTLEGKVQGWGRNRTTADTLYVVKGITIDRESDILGYVTSSETNTSVPVAKKWYMALLKIKDGKYSAVGFLFEHKEYDTTVVLPEYRRTIKELQDEVGVDFFHLLPDEIEREVESSFTVKDWPGI
ncbi:DNA/RNA non-specific endonuclease [Porphyromonas sp.]|uniref:DNA/RNA non-specific endonuclease n=1 Tax=Porphyromonas sp. TaxID=1924944 RepID=UPI0026DD0FB3|nr:DNA/RNA non-specific endonuclease [Porphyromonas sp.]MDO4695480.1 DNA/RNA non-specific endonuclease [Porphyromonas sp.]MDO4770286.1 DNA/RNA non-specific endonuclease [Porphyromonas sp.]